MGRGGGGLGKGPGGGPSGLAAPLVREEGRGRRGGGEGAGGAGRSWPAAPRARDVVEKGEGGRGGAGVRGAGREACRTAGGGSGPEAAGSRKGEREASRRRRKTCPKAGRGCQRRGTRKVLLPGAGGVAHRSDTGCRGGDGEPGGSWAAGGGASTGVGGWDGSLECQHEEESSTSKSEPGSRVSEVEGSGTVGRSGRELLAGSAGAGALIPRASLHANWTRDRRGGGAVRGGAPRAGLLSRLSRKGKRCLSGPQIVHASRSALFKPHDHADCSIPWVLFPARGGVLQARLYIEPPYRARNAASAALSERRSPQGERGRNTTGDHPQICETRDRRQAGDPVVSDPAGSFPPA